MEYVVFAVVIVIFLILIFVRETYRYKQSEKKFIRSLYDCYGTLPKREYKPEQFEVISHYFLKHKADFYIDDITWNDLDLDEVFKKMNFTYSAAGEEYLYFFLRQPSFDQEELEQREKIIDYFSQNADDRTACQFLYSKLGRTGKFSIYDYLDYLDQLGERNNLKHYLALVLIFMSIGLMFVHLPFGLAAFVLVLIYNNLIYFRIKGEIEPYITSFAYIFRILNTAKKLQEHRVSVLTDDMDTLKKCCGAMTGFETGSFLLMSGGRMSGSGNPLDLFLDFIRMGFHLDLIKFNQMLSSVRRHIGEIDQMITILGRIEALIAVGAYRASLEQYCIPEFMEQKELFANGIYHPLLTEPVRNNVHTKSSVLITGSNASGKSTFLKTVAINAILAQTVHTCLAEKYHTGMFRVLSSMSLRDDVQSGESYYMVEIKALKRIMDQRSVQGVPVLCFVDEVLRGTNTVERIAASTQILNTLASGNCICFAATHDIELTYLLEQIYVNYHFREEIDENDIFFSYKLMDGRAQSRNAIKLLGIMGFSTDIIRKAEHMAEDFLENGVWQTLDCQKGQ